MTRSQRLELVEKAKELGAKAFTEKKKSIPVQDSNLMELIKESRPVIGNQIGSSSFLFKAWGQAWNQANLLH